MKIISYNQSFQQDPSKNKSDCFKKNEYLKIRDTKQGTYGKLCKVDIVLLIRPSS